MTKDIGEKIREARLAKSMTLDAVVDAMELDMSKATLSRLETGEVSIEQALQTIERFSELCRVLDVDFPDAVKHFDKLRKRKRR